MCCGNRRKNAAPRIEQIAQPPVPRPQAQAMRPPVSFEYTGQTSLAVIGPITRAMYRFSAPGSRIPVDARDAPAVAAVPNVRRASA